MIKINKTWLLSKETEYIGYVIILISMLQVAILNANGEINRFIIAITGVSNLLALILIPTHNKVNKVAFGLMVTMEFISIITNCVETGKFITSTAFTLIVLLSVALLMYYIRKHNKRNHRSGTYINKVIFYLFSIIVLVAVSNTIDKSNGFISSLFISLWAILPLISAVTFSFRGIDFLVVMVIENVVYLRILWMQLVLKEASYIEIVRVVLMIVYIVLVIRNRIKNKD